MFNNIQHFQDIYLVQSYPVLNNLLNKVYFSDSQTLIIVIGNKSLERFFYDLFANKEHITVKRFGNTNFLLSRLKKLFYPFHLLKLRIFVKKYKCVNLYVTFKDWADFGIIQIKSISSKNRFILNPFEAQQYKIKDTKPKTVFETLYYLFHRLTIGKNLSLKEVSPKLNRKVPLLGLDNKFLRESNFEIIDLAKRDVDKAIMDSILKNQKVSHKGIIFIEKDLLETGIVNREVYWSFVSKLVSSINALDLEVYLKFKPRNYSPRLQKKYEAIGMKILPHYIPLQFFCGDPRILMGLGFTSSSMAYDESFEIISFCKAIKINEAAKNIVARSLKNTIHRAGSKQIKLPNSIQDIVSVIKQNM